jgi:hypothetical protein
MDKAVRRRLQELENRVGSKTPVINIRVRYVAPRKWVEDDDGPPKEPGHDRKVN